MNLLDFVETLPDGFAQPVRERGVLIHGPETAHQLRSRPGVFRYLILDEATSSVDTETEFRIRAALARLVEGRTSIVIAHRLSTIQRRPDHRYAQRPPAEIGSHQELLALRGIYWKLYQLQYKDQENRATPASRGASRGTAVPFVLESVIRSCRRSRPLFFSAPTLPLLVERVTSSCRGTEEGRFE